jgi:hypothetical protein
MQQINTKINPKVKAMKEYLECSPQQSQKEHPFEASFEALFLYKHQTPSGNGIQLCSRKAFV